jgi:hypothetical protein
MNVFSGAAAALKAAMKLSEIAGFAVVAAFANLTRTARHAKAAAQFSVETV